MRLLDTNSSTLVPLPDCKLPAYAILSHTWGETADEPTQHDAYRPPPASRSCGEDQWSRGQNVRSQHIKHARGRARELDISYLWIESLCVDRSSAADVVESVVCPFRRLWDAALCIVHLPDLSPVGDAPSLGELERSLSGCRWFTCPRTLPELVVPRRTEFFDQEWNHVGTKDANSPRVFLEILSRISGVDISVLTDRENIFKQSLLRHSSCAADHHTAGSEDVTNLMPRADSLRVLAWADGVPPPAKSSFEPLCGQPLEQCAKERIPSESYVLDPSGPSGGSSSSSSDERHDVDGDIFLFDELPERVEPLAPDHVLNSSLQPFVQLGHEAWQDKKSSYRHPSSFSPSPSYQSCSWREDSTPPDGSSKSEYTVTTISSSPSRLCVRPTYKTAAQGPVACPFYRFDPTEHYDCHWSLSLPNIRSTIQHLIVDHRLAYFCPICRTTFPKAAGRDRHIVARSCERRHDVALPVGVSEDQEEKLNSAYQQWIAGGTSEEEQWFWIWEILFLGLEKPTSAYLSEAREREMVALRRFWFEEGLALISRELERRDLICLDGPSGQTVREEFLASVFKGILGAAGLAGPDNTGKAN